MRTHRLFKPSLEAIPKPNSPTDFLTTFEFQLQPGEVLHTLCLKSKWHYASATLYADDKYMADWYLEFQDMLAQLTLPVLQWENYARMTGRDLYPLPPEGTVSYMLPLELRDGKSALPVISKVYKKIKVVYEFASEEARETELFALVSIPL